VSNILKKVEGTVPQGVQADLLREAPEQALFAALQEAVPVAQRQFDAHDYTGSLQALAVLKAPVDAFFEDVMVNAEDEALRRNRLALLQQLHGAMNQVADLSRLAA
ncbi:MAG: DALR anticodon-binding domain-containing protein, partial [Betaproteobacteria bacterium]